MSKIVVKSIEQNVNFLKTDSVEGGYKLYPVRYSTIKGNSLVESCSKNSYVPKAYMEAAMVAIIEAMENHLLNGHSIELPDFGIFSISCESTVAKTPSEAGVGQLKGLKINFRPSTTLKTKLENVDVELDGVWKCLDLTAENKVYERVTNASNDGVELPDGEGDEVVNPDGPSNGDNGGNGGGGFAG
ncbi:MAG: HU family DNA-binding protein [Bacteroidales bacterium]|nr:HU family DNA-binding protein [Bacteroidales bacterium]